LNAIGTSTLSQPDHRPAGVNTEPVLRAVQGDPDWEMLRHEICNRGILLTDKLTFDLRELLTVGKYLQAAGRLMWQQIKPFQPELLIGPGFGAMSLLYSITLAALADGVNLSVLMVRDQRKQHRRKRWIEGAHYPGNTRAVLVDDFIGRGSGIDLVEEALAADKRVLNICAAAVFFDHWSMPGSRQLSVSKFPVVSLFKRHDIGLSRDCYDAQPPAMLGNAPPLVGSPLWWRFELNGHSAHPSKCAPVIADNAVFVADDRSRVWRLDGNTGETVWQYDSLGRPYKGIVQQLQHADGSLVFGCYDGTITRLNANDGEIVWRWRPDSHIHATPTLDLRGQRLFINTEQEGHGIPFGHLYALDWATGKVIWQYRQAYWPPCTAVYHERFNAVLACANDKSLICVDADTGTLRWQVRTRGLVRGKPGICGNTILVATESGHLQSFDIASGELLHSRRHGRGLRHQFLHTDESAAYVLDDMGHMSVFNVDDFRYLWVSKLRAAGVWTPLPLHQHLVVLSRQGQLAVLDKQRQIKLWEGKIGGHYQQPPAIGKINGRPMMVAASNNSGLKAFLIHSFYDQPAS